MKPGNQQPINKTAAMVMSAGTHYEPVLNTQNDRKNPLPISPVSKAEAGQADFKDITGFIFGRFTVLGRHSESSRWVVRCDCGVYTTRKKKAISNPKNSQDRCQMCRKLISIKRSYAFNKTGKDQNIGDYSE